MNIRSEFKSVEDLLARLISYSYVFDSNNREHWPHLKHTELGYYRPCSIEDELLTLIYATGRDLAVHMSFKLQQFNDARLFPTIKSYVDSFEGGWLHEIDLLEVDSNKAKEMCKGLGASKWAIEHMIKLYDAQIILLYEIKKITTSLKLSDVYQWESNGFQQNYANSPHTKIVQSLIAIGKGLERHPRAYLGKDEESLRDYLLVALQANTSSVVTGETYNKRGKTDLLVREGIKNIIVGECKIWKGRSIYLQAISQLLGYLTTADNNAILLIFVKIDGFTNIINKIMEITSSHPQYIRCTLSDNIVFEFEFNMNEDSGAIVNLSVVLFHLPEKS